MRNDILQVVQIHTMENRRRHYRHDFPVTRPLFATLKTVDGMRFLTADVIDLSIGGMCVYAAALRGESAEQWTVTLTLSPDVTPIHLTAERIHKMDGDPARCGFQFHVSKDQELADEQEKRIWKFLLDEQRRRRSQW